MILGACTDVDGGAVELSWKLRAASGPNESGEFLSCPECNPLPGTGQVAKIEISWMKPDGTGSGAKLFCCKDGHGVTGFELPPGDTLLTVTPICGGGLPADPRTYTSPAPEERHVITGNTISLGAVEIILQTSSCPVQSCICR